MMPSNAVEAESAPEGAEAGFDHAIAGMSDFGDGNSADLAESLRKAAADMNEAAAEFGGNNALIMGLPVMMKVVLGSAKMPVATLAKLAKGSVVKLDKMVGDQVDILVNGRLIARGEVVVLNEGTSRFGVVLTQVGSLPPVAK
ncbi:FliM/FliN family flagellar motor switch protein [Hyphomicrobium sp. 99]|uniref:FliM/FliN family flagellar motor switch protein n=1 Tax=Hyphomicrobium sp. 99 TaxID=1163419 RepID=UPI0009E470A8|nr:FliM/FliN family flagellar motor switch protein [Hyphomicrobium sp. 99]